MVWPTWEAVRTGHPDLASERLIPIRDSLLAEAIQTVKDDLAGRYDVANMTREEVPIQVARLAVYKARDLGYVSFWGSEPPAGTSAPQWRKQYAELLTRVLEDAGGELAAYLLTNGRARFRVI